MSLKRPSSALRNMRNVLDETRQQSRERRANLLGAPVRQPTVSRSAGLAAMSSHLRDAGLTGEQEAGWLENLPKPVTGALRGLASMLEPFQLPQDVFFATVAGVLDRETTVAERLARVQWGHYAPGGEAPERVADGQEIMKLMGFDDTVAKWGGIAADLVVDPLVFGSWFRVAGKLSKSAELVNMGNRIDRLMSPAGVATDLNRVARRSESYRAWQDSTIENLLAAVRNPESQVFGIQRFGEKVTGALDRILPQDTMLQVRFGRELGRDIGRVKREAEIFGRDTVSQALLDIERIMAGASGEMQRDMVRGVLRSLDESAFTRQGILEQINIGVVREAMDSAVSDVVMQQRGASFAALGGRVPDELDPSGQLRALGGEIREALAAGFDPSEAHNAERIINDMLMQRMDSAVAGRRSALIDLAGEEARKLGLSVEEVERTQRRTAELFDEYLASALTIDARIGLVTSGYDFISTGIRKRAVELGASMDEAASIFQTILRTGLLRGQKGIEELWNTATNITIRGPRYHSQRDVMRRVEDVRIRTNAVLGYTGELNALKDSFKTTVRAPAQRYRRTIDSLRAQRDEAIQATRAERDQAVAGWRRRSAKEQEELDEVARAARAERDEAVEGLRAERAAGQQATSDEYSDLLFAGHASVLVRSERLAEAMSRLSPQRLSPRITRDPLFTELPDTARQLRDARVRYEAYADEIVAAERVNGNMASKFIRAEKEVLDLVAKQEEMLTRFEALLGDVATTARRGPSRTLSGLRERVAGWRSEAADLRVALQESRDYKMRHVEMVKETARGFREENLAASRAAREAARGVTEQAEATKAAVRESAQAGIGETRSYYRSVQDDIRRGYQQRAGEARAARDSAVEEAQARVAATRASMEAEYDALGRGKPGSAKDRAYVARHAAGRPRREPIEPAHPMALQGTNASLDEILAARLERAEERLYRGARPADDADIRLLTQDEVEELLREPITFGELMGSITEMQALPLGDYLQGLMNGHLRKTYGLFMDGTNFQTYIDRVRRGSIISGALIDEMNLRQLMPGLEAEADLISGYHQALVSAGGGKVLRRSGIERHLAENGVSSERINQAMEAIIRGLNDSPAFHTALDVLKERQLTYLGQIRQAQRIAAGSDTPMVANRRFFQERVNLPDEIAATLGEHAQASLSLYEGARVAERVAGRQEFTQRLYNLARDHGLIKSAPFVNPYRTRYVKLGDGDSALGGFAGQWVHPYLVKELQRLASVEPQFLGAGFQRLRSLITGGYLASPSVLAANFVGGFYQAATAGVNPVVMAKRMQEVLPDMVAASRGEVTELMAALKRHLDLEMSSLVGSERIQDFSRLIRDNIEMSPEGMRRFADNMARKYEEFLQRPGIGKFRVPFAGLEGFQFSENWFKVAAFKEMREQLARNGAPPLRPGGPRRQLTPAEVDAAAAEFARLVVFDYSQLPLGLERLKQSGLVMFPGFPYFLASRTLSAALNRPGTLAVADRLTEAISNVTLDPLDQIAAYLGMPEYLREEQGVPLPFSVRAGSGGHDQVSMIPFAQLVPTNTIWDGLVGGGSGSNPWAESITQAGMWGPLFDVLTALVYNDGEATVTARFGHRVHDPGAEGAEKAGQVFRFLYNTMAPSIIRRGIRQDYQGQLQGLLPGLGEMLAGLGSPMPEELASVLYTFEERRTGRPERGWREDVIASFLRTPTLVALEGPLAGIREEMENARGNLNDELGVLTTRYRRAQEAGDEAAAARIFERMKAKRDEFNEKWRAYVEFYRANTARRQQQRGQ